MTNELEPCPFRKEGETHELTITDAMGEAWVRCSCGVDGPMFSGQNRKEQAAEHWNTRYKRTCKMPMYHGEDADDDLPAYYRNFKCDACGELHSRYKHDDYEFCPHCGAEVVDGD